MRNFGAGSRARGGIYKNKNAYTRLSLSLSLSLSPPVEKREREERLGGVGPRSGPTTRLPFLASMLMEGPSGPIKPVASVNIVYSINVAYSGNKCERPQHDGASA